MAELDLSCGILHAFKPIVHKMAKQSQLRAPLMKSRAKGFASLLAKHCAKTELFLTSAGLLNIHFTSILHFNKPNNEALTKLGRSKKIFRCNRINLQETLNGCSKKQGRQIAHSLPGKARQRLLLTNLAL